MTPDEETLAPVSRSALMKHAASSSKNLQSGGKTRVFVVDDSPLMCRVVERILSQDPDLDIAGHALSGSEALEALSKARCDVCTLDVHMPGMNGLTVLKNIMIRFPKPTLMVSAFTADGARVTFEALRYGAVDFFQKPSQNTGRDLEAQGALFRARVKRAARVQVTAARYLRLKQLHRAGRDRQAHNGPGRDMPRGLTVIGASTGGYAALLSLLPIMNSAPAEPVLVALGTPPEHLDAFVDYLQAYSPFPVVRAADGRPLQKGVLYFASSEDSSCLERKENELHLCAGPRHKLSGQAGGLDLLLYSASEIFGRATLSVFLSGDSMDGLDGAREVRRTGGRILVQRPDTCLAPEMGLAVADETQADVCGIPDLAARIPEWTA